MTSHSAVINDLKNNYLNRDNMEVIRIENAFSVGMPDLLVQIPNRTLYIEVKQIYDYLSKTQQIWWKRALQLRQKCFIIVYTWNNNKYSYGLFLPKKPDKKSWGDCLWSSSDSVNELRDILFNA